MTDEVRNNQIKMECQRYENFILMKDPSYGAWAEGDYIGRTHKSLMQRRWRVGKKAEELGFLRKTPIMKKENYSEISNLSIERSDDEDTIVEVNESLLIMTPQPNLIDICDSPMIEKFPLIDLFDTLISNPPPIKTFSDAETQTGSDYDPSENESQQIECVMSFEDLKNLQTEMGKKIRLSLKN
jgi:hypothetical protein